MVNIPDADDADVSVENPDRELLVQKPNWDWVLIRRGIFEQARYHKARGDTDRSEKAHSLHQDILMQESEARFSLERWALIAEDLTSYSKHLRYGFSEDLADVYMEYVNEIEALIEIRDDE